MTRNLITHQGGKKEVKKENSLQKDKKHKRQKKNREKKEGKRSHCCWEIYLKIKKVKRVG